MLFSGCSDLDDLSEFICRIGTYILVIVRTNRCAVEALLEMTVSLNYRERAISGVPSKGSVTSFRMIRKTSAPLVCFAQT